MDAELPISGRCRAGRARPALESLHPPGPALSGRHGKCRLLSAGVSDLPWGKNRCFSFGLAALPARRFRHEEAGLNIASRAVAELFHGVELPCVRPVDDTLGDGTITLLLGH